MYCQVAQPVSGQTTGRLRRVFLAADVPDRSRRQWSTLGEKLRKRTVDKKARWGVPLWRLLCYELIIMWTWADYCSVPETSSFYGIINMIIVIIVCMMPTSVFSLNWNFE